MDAQGKIAAEISVGKSISLAPETSAKSVSAMSFPKAMEGVVNGKKVHKLEWVDRAYYAHQFGGFLMLHKPDGNHRWIVSDGDMLGEDYIVIA